MATRTPALKFATQWSLGRVAAGLALAIATALVGAVLVSTLAARPQQTVAGSGLSAQQLVIRSEVADRSAAQAPAIAPDRSVIRSEVADRIATQATSLTPLQVVIRGEVADRYAND
jgi:hypothetical protein